MVPFATILTSVLLTKAPSESAYRHLPWTVWHKCFDCCVQAAATKISRASEPGPALTEVLPQLQVDFWCLEKQVLQSGSCRFSGRCLCASCKAAGRICTYRSFDVMGLGYNSLLHLLWKQCIPASVASNAVLCCAVLCHVRQCSANENTQHMSEHCLTAGFHSAAQQASVTTLKAC